MGRPLRLWALILASLLTLSPAGAEAQTVANRFYTLDQERFFAESDFGRRVFATLNERSQTLAEENRRIEETLRQEERALTDQRPTLQAAEFRELADAFDKKVEAIRAEQVQKGIDLNAWLDAERQRFGEAAFPLLLNLAKDLGASVILDRRSVILASDQSDITDIAISTVNDGLGDGAAAAAE